MPLQPFDYCLTTFDDRLTAFTTAHYRFTTVSRDRICRSSAIVNIACLGGIPPPPTLGIFDNAVLFILQLPRARPLPGNCTLDKSDGAFLFVVRTFSIFSNLFREGHGILARLNKVLPQEFLTLCSISPTIISISPGCHIGCPCNKGSAARRGDICFAKM